MTLRSLAFFLIPILLFGACHSSHPSVPEDDDDQLYDEPYAMANFLKEPRKAMALIDSAFEAQNISDERRQYLKADRKSTRLNSSHIATSRMPSSA